MTLWTFLDAHPFMGLSLTTLVCATVAYVGDALAEAWKEQRRR